MIKRLLKFRSFVMLAAIVVFAMFASPRFATAGNLMNLLTRIHVNGIVAVGMTIVIITGGFDLSVGSVMAFAGIVVMAVLPAGIVPAMLAGICVGAAVGALNGAIIAYFGINPFITTLGTMAFVRGLALGVTNARPVPCVNVDFIMMGMSVGPAIFMFVLIAAMQFYLGYTRGGHNIYIFGSNKEAGFTAGIDMKRTQMKAYLLCSVCASFAGIFLSARLGTGSPVIANDAALLAITAVILGGTSLSGGGGSVVRTLIGILILEILTNILNLIGVTTYFQTLIKGLLVVGVVALEAPRFISKGAGRRFTTPSSAA